MRRCIVLVLTKLTLCENYQATSIYRVLHRRWSLKAPKANFPFLTPAMDESSRNSYPQLSVRDWRSHGYIDHDETKSYHPLASSIHPIFSFLRTKPKPGSIDQSFQRWGTLAAEEYQSLKPVLCLASLMLVSPASLRFFHSIMYGPRR